MNGLMTIDDDTTDISKPVSSFEDVKRNVSRWKSNKKFSKSKLPPAGLSLTNNEHIVRCDECSFELSQWENVSDLFTLHAEKCPECPFIQIRIGKFHKGLTCDNKPSDGEEAMVIDSENKTKYRWNELEEIKTRRRRTFSHWSSNLQTFVELLVTAGFFSCAVGDRVICVYCHLICQSWKTDRDDPIQVHTVLSPTCPYVRWVLLNPEPTPVFVINDISSNNQNSSGAVSNVNPSQRSAFIDYTSPYHASYSDITKRVQSFATWSTETGPSVEALAKAGFFYSGVNQIVTCFYCNGSLQGWGEHDNPSIEHARWFENCSYIKQLCGEDLLRSIREAKRIHREQTAGATGSNNGVSNQTSVTRKLLISPNESNLLPRYVAARLDLPIGQYLLNIGFNTPVIRRCWEDQLQQKNDDFVDDGDVFLSCTILQLQIDIIQGKKENIITPSIKMKQIQEGESRDVSEPIQPPAPTNNADEAQRRSNAVAEQVPSNANRQQSEPLKTTNPKPKKNTTLTNPCIICYGDEKQLACLPCGHLAACVSCSHSVKICPVCRRAIEAFIRVYI